MSSTKRRKSDKNSGKRTVRTKLEVNSLLTTNTNSSNRSNNTSSSSHSNNNISISSSIIHPKANVNMCVYCFDAVFHHLNKRKTPPRINFTNPSCAVFVSWKKRSKKNNSVHSKLRGCIGTFRAQPLHDGLKTYAIESAFNDRRFSPLTYNEVKELQCNVSLLTNFEEGINYNDWEIGTHGITITFYVKGKKCSATYLPEVPKEVGWTKKEALTSLIRKAGYDDTIGDAIWSQLKLTRYQSSKAYLTFDQYRSIYCRKES